MLGDVCEVCAPNPCGCPVVEEEASPCIPGPENGECPTWIDFKCLFWMGDPIAGTPIKKGTRGTEVLYYLLNRIKELETAVADLAP